MLNILSGGRDGLRAARATALEIELGKNDFRDTLGSYQPIVAPVRLTSTSLSFLDHDRSRL